MITDSRYYTEILLGEVINTTKTSVRVIGVSDEMRTWDVSITYPETYLLINGLILCSLENFVR